MKIKLLNTKPVIRKSFKSVSLFRRICYIIISCKPFEIFILSIIIINTLVLTINWYDIPNEVSNIVQYINYAFAAVFTIEATLKLIALGSLYFKDNWNIFDFIIVLATIMSVVLDFTTSIGAGGKATIIRAFRVARIFRIISKVQSKFYYQIPQYCHRCWG